MSNKQKSIVIADITSLKKGNQSFGHFLHVANMYTKILQKEYSVYVAGGPIYQRHFKNILKLKYDVDLTEFERQTTKIFSKVKELLNTRELLKSTREDSNIIFQSYSNTMLFFSLFLFKTRNKVFLIQYKNELGSLINKLLFRLIRKKISGIIVSKKIIGEAYNLPYIVVPDYIYLGSDPQVNINEPFDYGVFGIIRQGKDVVNVAKLFVNQNLKLIIAGSIQDSGMKKELEEIAVKNPNVTLINRYLPENEYNDLINKTKCVILPYSDSYYNESSSGVIFDILFRKKPVITKNFTVFKFVRDENLGILYDDLNQINLETLIEKENYNKIQVSINSYLKKNSKKKVELLNFIRNQS